MQNARDPLIKKWLHCTARELVYPQDTFKTPSPFLFLCLKTDSLKIWWTLRLHRLINIHQTRTPLPLSSSFLISLSLSSYFRSLHLGLNLSWTQTNGFSLEIIQQHFSDPWMYNAKRCLPVASNCPFECLMFELINMICHLLFIILIAPFPRLQ